MVKFRLSPAGDSERLEYVEVPKYPISEDLNAAQRIRIRVIKGRGRR